MPPSLRFLPLWLLMASLASLNAGRRILDRLAASAKKDLASLGIGDRVIMSNMLADGWVAIVEKYGTQSAEIGAEQFDRWARELGLPPRVKVAPGVNERQAMARLGWALSTEAKAANAEILLDALVLQPYRDTVQDSAWASGGAWARVPYGAKPCEFCLMLASRGEVYASEASAGGDGGAEYHGDCRCVPVLVMGSDTYPDGYDPNALLDQYEAGRASAGSGDAKAILAGMRRTN